MMSGFAHAIAVEHEDIGEARGENRLAKLINTLLSLGRTDDAMKATSNEEARKEFYKEFGMID